MQTTWMKIPRAYAYAYATAFVIFFLSLSPRGWAGLGSSSSPSPSSSSSYYRAASELGGDWTGMVTGEGREAKHALLVFFSSSFLFFFSFFFSFFTFFLYFLYFLSVVFIEREGERERERNQGRQESEREVSFGGYFLVGENIYWIYICIYSRVYYLPTSLPTYPSLCQQ